MADEKLPTSVRAIVDPNRIESFLKLYEKGTLTKGDWANLTDPEFTVVQKHLRLMDEINYPTTPE